MYFAMHRLDYIGITGRSSDRGRQMGLGWGKRAIFELNASLSRKQ